MELRALLNRESAETGSSEWWTDRLLPRISVRTFFVRWSFSMYLFKIFLWIFLNIYIFLIFIYFKDFDRFSNRQLNKCRNITLNDYGSKNRNAVKIFLLREIQLYFFLYIPSCSHDFNYDFLIFFNYLPTTLIGTRIHDVDARASEWPECLKRELDRCSLGARVKQYKSRRIVEAFEMCERIMSNDQG